jgi:hypothetical protein
VELNGLVTQTADSEIQLNLKNGRNTLKISTNLPCQGTYEDSFFISSKPIVYPNPVGASTKVFLNGIIGEVEVQVFSANGRLVHQQVKETNGNELEMDFSTLPTGAYYMSIQSLDIKEVFKLIKE